MEAESAELADRLVRGQVDRAQDNEISYTIKTESEALQRAHIEVTHQLKIANEEIRGLSLRLQENVSYLYILYEKKKTAYTNFGDGFLIIIKCRQSKRLWPKQ